MSIPIEDNFNDIVGKAQRGLSLDNAQLAERAAVSVESLQQLHDGHVDEIVLRKIAPALSLNADALVAIARKRWKPREQTAISGLLAYNTSYEDMTVNAYLVWDPATKQGVVFDTGTDVTDILNDIVANGIQLQAILITHTHGDHIFEIDRLREKTKAPAFAGDREPTLDGTEAFTAGRAWTVGNLTIESRLTWGHAEGGITYVVRGLEKTLAIVGDALFAGSMGGGNVSYPDALRTNREEILTLPDEVVLCPGHGPLTTVGEEKTHNPFLAI